MMALSSLAFRSTCGTQSGKNREDVGIHPDAASEEAIAKFHHLKRKSIYYRDRILLIHNTIIRDLNATCVLSYWRIFFLLHLRSEGGQRHLHIFVHFDCGVFNFVTGLQYTFCEGVSWFLLCEAMSSDKSRASNCIFFSCNLLLLLNWWFLLEEGDSALRTCFISGLEEVDAIFTSSFTSIVASSFLSMALNTPFVEVSAGFSFSQSNEYHFDPGMKSARVPSFFSSLM